MTFYDFQTTTFGKWILAGEHAVLRGKAALVFPVKQKKLQLDFKASAANLSSSYEGDTGSDIHLLFWSVLEHGQQLLGKSLNEVSGHFHLYCDIPVGAGMGASAALCVAMARWFVAQKLLNVGSVFAFAKNLEDLFHGKSSGLDIAGVSTELGIYFQNGKISPLSQNWQPQWYLSNCGQVGITSHCINQVKEIWQADSLKASGIDERMHKAVLKAQQALTQDESAIQQLKEALDEALNCFKAWGLISETLENHMTILTQQGALACKPTGSGGGGYVLSLWDRKPTNDLAMELIAL